MLAFSVPTKSGRQHQSGYHSPLRVRQAAKTRQGVLFGGNSSLRRTRLGWYDARGGGGGSGNRHRDRLFSLRIKVWSTDAAIDVAIVGDDGEVPLVDRPEFAALASANGHSAWPRRLG